VKKKTTGNPGTDRHQCVHDAHARANAPDSHIEFQLFENSKKIGKSWRQLFENYNKSDKRPKI
jgi:hypothetical protein